MDSDRPPPVSVTIGAARWRAVLDDAPLRCRQAVRAALDRAAGVPWLAAGEVGVLLGDDQVIRQLNARHRDQDQATNVLSFPLLDLDCGRPVAGAGQGAAPDPRFGPVLLGDIALALETVCAEAGQAGKPIGDHLCHLAVHGTLHLLGFDHQDDDEARVMEDLERRILADLQIPDPYQDLHIDHVAAAARDEQHAREAV